MSKNLLSFIIVTNGKGSHIKECIRAWALHPDFEFGLNLYFCGPESLLSKHGVSSTAIIDYADGKYYGANFLINNKKLLACSSVNSEFIYLLHDRFIPGPNLRFTIETQLTFGDIDYGAIDVLNADSTLALGELRLRNDLFNGSIDKALSKLGRLIVDVSHPSASPQIAINGGQFFIRTALSRYLERPLRWGEMEDDILSFDLREFSGKWIAGTHLITLTPRIAPVYRKNAIPAIKYFWYRIATFVLAALFRCFVFKHSVLAVGSFFSVGALDIFIERGLILIDPLHKVFASDFLPASLEKVMVRGRLRTEGHYWRNVCRAWYGWRLE